MILQNYIYQSPAFFTREEVQRIHAAAEKLPYKDSMIGQQNRGQDAEDHVTEGNIDNTIRQGGTKWFINEENHMPADITAKIAAVINMANMDCNWNHTIEYQENPQYTIYNRPKEKKSGDFYTWHTDAGPMHYDNGMHRKLSMTIQLSDQDDYEGGHFQWLEPQRQFDKMKSTAFGVEGLNPSIDMNEAIRTVPFSSREIGSVLVFPSFVYHQVTPVLSGCRKSLVVWFVGKPYV